MHNIYYNPGFQYGIVVMPATYNVPISVVGGPPKLADMALNVIKNLHPEMSTADAVQAEVEKRPKSMKIDNPVLYGFSIKKDIALCNMNIEPKPGGGYASRVCFDSYQSVAFLTKFKMKTQIKIFFQL